MPHREVNDGDEVFIRAQVLQACSDAFQVRVLDYPNMAVTVWVPARECAKAEDIGRLLPQRRDPEIAWWEEREKKMREREKAKRESLTRS